MNLKPGLNHRGTENTEETLRYEMAKQYTERGKPQHFGCSLCLCASVVRNCE